MKKLNQDGYIAITTVIVLSLVMLSVAIALSSSGFFSRFDAVDFSNKRDSYFLARSCMNYARYRLGLNSNYSGNETVNISSNICLVGSVITSGANKIIQASATVNRSTTRLRLTINRTNLSTVSFEELVSF